MNRIPKKAMTACMLSAILFGGGCAAKPIESDRVCEWLVSQLEAKYAVEINRLETATHQLKSAQGHEETTAIFARLARACESPRPLGSGHRFTEITRCVDLTKARNWPQYQQAVRRFAKTVGEVDGRFSGARELGARENATRDAIM